MKEHKREETQDEKNDCFVIAYRVFAYLYDRLKSGKVAVRRRLADKDITEFNRNRIERLIARVNDDITDVYGRHYGVWREQIIDFAKAETEFTGRALKNIVDVDFDLPTRAQVRAAGGLRQQQRYYYRLSNRIDARRQNVGGVSKYGR